MANLTETATYEAGIYRFETTDPVQGGPGGIDNLPTNQLANRTAWLKAQVEAILLDIAAIESGYASAASLAGHTGNTSNPHVVTKAQVGLGNVLNYGVATQAEAEAGAVDTKYMTPLRAKQAIAAQIPAATETVAGLIKLATAAEAQAMSDVSRAITPAALNSALKGANQALSTNGYQRMPGGLILQWGTLGIGSWTPSETASNNTVTFPVAFPGGMFSAAAAPSVGITSIGITIEEPTTTNMRIRYYNEKIYVPSLSIRWIAIGW
jgi:hypothetical protein